MRIILAMLLASMASSCAYLMPGTSMTESLLYQVEKDHACAIYDMRVSNDSGGTVKKQKYFVTACGKKLVYLCERGSDSLINCKEEK